MNIKSYTELMSLSTYEERYNYLKLDGTIGDQTFGGRRWMNQHLYTSAEWKRLRHQLIVRDNGNDMGVDGHEIHGRLIIHHMNPITIKDVIDHSPCVFDPENLICVSDSTHRAIHYGDLNSLDTGEVLVREPNDTCPWK